MRILVKANDKCSDFLLYCYKFQNLKCLKFAPN